MAFTIIAACGDETPVTVAEKKPATGGLSWPMVGARGTEWSINNYVDLDPTTGLRDHTGATGANARTYDGHNGIDIDIGSFRRMDSGEALVYAAAAGIVERVSDGFNDRNLSCAGNANYVEVRHPNGTLARYFHLKKQSVAVTVGQQVTTATVLGVVGSSGCSTNAHLHFEMRDAQGRVLDPFLEGLWSAPPTYQAPLSIMEGVIRPSPFTAQDVRTQLFDPGANTTSATVGATIGIGVIAADGAVGSRIKVTATNAAGVEVFSNTLSFSQPYRTSTWTWNSVVNSAGTWTIRIFANDVEAKRYTLLVQ